MSNPLSPPADVLALIHEGWGHLRAQRPLAAWAAWQRALRRSPGDKAARQALEALANAPHLPSAAKAVYRFRMPENVNRRSRWNALLLNHDLDELDAASDAFTHLYATDPTDASAGYNAALCMAWLGYNADAIDLLARVVGLLAASHPEEAISAWVLAEVLRQGGGAEHLADELRHTLIIPMDSDVDEWIRESESDGPWRRLPDPTDPDAPPGRFADTRVYEWYDAAPPEPRDGEEVSKLPRVLASVICTPGEVRLTSPDPLGLAIAQARIPFEGERQATPLPLNMLDAAAWCFRLPAGIPEGERKPLMLDALSRYYETTWTETPRHGLGWQPPERAARGSDPTRRAQLEAILRFREQVDAHSQLGAGLGLHYDFDALRERLGLIPPRTNEHPWTQPTSPSSPT